MLNIIAICPSVSLDLQTRALIRTTDGQQVTLPASACLCLQALVDAKGEILSQEQLMEIGWRSQGVEVTDNSVRVMINKLRRALNELDLQDVLTLLAVTRSGYRLIVRDAERLLLAANPATIEQHGVIEPPLTASEPSASQSQPTLVPVAPRRWRRGVVALAAGMILGWMMGLILRSLYIPVPINVEFVRWNGSDIPAQTEVWVEKDKQQHTQQIEDTLRTYARYTLERRPTERPLRVLYITHGAISMTKNHQGLIACQQPLKEHHNECEAFYFHLN